MVLPFALLPLPHLDTNQDTGPLVARYIASELKSPPKAAFPESASRFNLTVKKPCEDQGGEIKGLSCVIPPPPPPPAPAPVYTPPAPSYVAPMGSCGDWMAQAGISDPQNAYTLILRESGCRVNAYNPSGAYGIPQALPGSKMASAGADWETNPVTQLRWMQGYVFSVYGSWANALNHSYTYNWY